MCVNDIVKIKTTGEDVKILSLKQRYGFRSLQPVIYATVKHLEDGKLESLPVSELITLQDYQDANAEKKDKPKKKKDKPANEEKIPDALECLTDKYSKVPENPENTADSENPENIENSDTSEN